MTGNLQLYLDYYPYLKFIVYLSNRPLKFKGIIDYSPDSSASHGVIGGDPRLAAAQNHHLLPLKRLQYGEGEQTIRGNTRCDF